MRNIDRKDIIIKSDSDNLEISVAMFIPDGEIKGIFQVSHGMAEHKERYYNFLEYLANQGYVTIINDHRGHGKSVKGKEDLGFFYDNSSDYIVEDLHQITLYAKELYPNKEMILFGHSMGSMVVRKYIKKYDKDINKLIVCGSPSKSPFVDLAIFTIKTIKVFKKEKYKSNFIQKLAIGNYNKTVKNAKSENSWICSNGETVEKYDNDELCGFTFTLNGFENLFKLMKEIYIEKGWAVKNNEMPILFIAGSDDPVIINEQKWMTSQEFLRKIGYVNVNGKLYKDLRHEILNEKNKQEIYNDIIEFIVNGNIEI